MPPYPATEHIVPFDQAFSLGACPTTPVAGAEASAKAELKALRKRLRELQRLFAADRRHALLVVIQGMDASGKDSAVRHVLRGVNPAGCRAWSFKPPSREERDHDFLWRSTRLLPARGEIAVFNRSYYEDVLVTRVHPELLTGASAQAAADASFWNQRYASINAHEAHLARNGTIVLKFFLHMSPEEQSQRFLRRMRRADKQWKLDPADLHERRYWSDYMAAYDAALSATSRPHAPWYAIPADHKPYARACIARVLVETLENLEPRYPQPSAEQAATIERMREELEGETTLR